MIESDTFTAILGAVRTGVVATILPAVQADQLAAGADITVLRLVSPTLERGIALYALKRDPQLPVISAVFAAIQAI
jgi:DNA-binding transcriptional LysR family regulator